MNQERPDTTATANGGTKRALVIDDDALIRNMLMNILTKNNFEVETASDGDDGLQKIASGHFDLVITDILMPGKEGLETILTLKKSTPDVKVLAISGGGATRNLSFLELARKLGANKILSKPFSAKDFMSNVMALT